MVWLTGQTIFSRIIGLLAQWILARWLLSPADFGQIGLVYTITALATSLTTPGVDEVLLQRQKRLQRWITPAFWMSLTCGLGGAVLTAMIGLGVNHVARHFGNPAYGNPQLFWLILILASGAPLNAVSLVPMVVLRSQMRFARIAAIGFGEVALQQSLIVLFAAMGFGAYSFVIPMPIVAALRNLALWLMVRPKIRWHMGFTRWPSLISSTGWIFGQRLLYMATSQGDYITLGIVFASDKIVGEYYFAFMLSTQVARLLSDNVSAVLVPGLNKIHEDKLRLQQATVRAMKGLVSMVIPVATLQVLLAGPVMRLLFPAKWAPSIPLLRWLSVGPILYTAAWPLASMLLASGRFRALFLLSVANVIAFFGLVIPFTMTWGSVGTALAVSLWGWVCALMHGAVAFESLRGVLIVLRASGNQILSAGIAALLSCAFLYLLPATRIGDVAAILLITPTVLAVYIGSLWMLDRQSLKLLSHELSAGLRPLRRLRSTPVVEPA